MPWHWSSQAKPASEGGLAAAELVPLGSAQRWGAGLQISGLEVLLRWPGDFKGIFQRSREMLQYTSKLEPWAGGWGGQLLPLPRSFWDNLGQGLVLCLSFCKAETQLSLLCC